MCSPMIVNGTPNLIKLYDLTLLHFFAHLTLHVLHLFNSCLILFAFKFTLPSTNVHVDRWTDEFMDGWMDGWTDGRTDGWMDG